MDFMNIKTASKKWLLSERRLTLLCRENRIEGAKKDHGIWMIPANAQKPCDGRKQKSENTHVDKKLALPLGISDYKK